MSIKMGKKQNIKNIAMNIVSFIVQFAINFYVAPLVVNKVGTSAYGFISLANDFVSYVSVLATVFNSVAARFIANSFYRKEYEKANRYFNSLIVTNIIISSVLGLVGAAFVFYMEKFLTIPDNLLFDVKLTFILIFGSYIVSLLTLVFTTSTFVANRTDIQGVRNILQYVIRFILIVLLINLVSVHIYWVALATLVSAIVVAILNVRLTKKLTPELKISLKKASKMYSFELAKSGCWMALTSISVILLRGLDLTIANIYLGDNEMGLLSIARTIPNNMTSIIATIAPIFTPTFIAIYVKKNSSKLVGNVKESINAMAMLLFVPITCFIVFSYDFYSLWQPSLSQSELRLVTVLSTLTIIQAFFNSTTSTIAQLSVVVNKLKLPVLISFACGVVSITAEIVMIKFFDLGLYAIVLSSSVIMILRYVIFNSIYGAWCLKQNKKCFLITVIKTWISIPFLFMITYAIRYISPAKTWITLIVDLLISLLIGYIPMILIYGKKNLKLIFTRKKSENDDKQ